MIKVRIKNRIRIRVRIRVRNRAGVKVTHIARSMVGHRDGLG